MLFREIILVYCEKHTNTLYGQNAAFLVLNLVAHKVIIVLSKRGKGKTTY
jgi:hypothetical protein